jgi:hypothetical protein
MLAATSDVLRHTAHWIGRSAALPLRAMLPAAAMLLAWPMLQIWLDDADVSFLTAFVLAYALLLVLHADGLIRHLRAQVAITATVAVVLSAGPGVLMVLIGAANPILCQHSVTVLLVAMAATSARWAFQRKPRAAVAPADFGLACGVAVAALILSQANEMMIQQLSPALWLVFFALLPGLAQILLRIGGGAIPDPPRRT